MGQKGNQNEIVVATGVSVYVNRFSLGQLDVIIFLFIVNKFMRMMQPAEKKEIAPHQPHFIFPVKFISLANRQFFFHRHKLVRQCACCCVTLCIVRMAITFID